MEKIYTEPTIVVMLGATGDLSKRKLIPAFFDLFEKGLLPKSFRIVGMARKPLTHDEYRDLARSVLLEQGHQHNQSMVDDFISTLSYVSGDVTNPESYRVLAEMLIDIEKEFAQCTNKIFYLAISPGFYDSVFRNLADSGLTIPCDSVNGWTRVLVEKPFGNNIETAKQLDKTLGMLFKEEQIFRIDHYLGKSVLQDILMFRFSNSIFEPVWNNRHIEKVEIILRETLGVEGRGSFFDGVGALRDVGQNHMLQMLALVAMENPGSLNADAIRAERAKVLESLHQIDAGSIQQHAVRGRYEGYTQEPNVDEASQTETYFRVKAYINNETWRGVPFYLEGGKALDKKETSVTVYFKAMEQCLCSQDHTLEKHQNILKFRLAPEEGIRVRFWANKSGFAKGLEPKDLSFSYGQDGAGVRLPDAYEYVLYDAISGEQTLFTSTDEVSAAWKFITPIIENWHHVELQTYEKGSRGPEITL